ncbi:hypothetical protein HD597_000821 [Nonomuraea thailandensis]|uniref:Uncharacterized protein n=1 Tax=Nonomuraea thailandensis TaxID=1188745 RepID=A0A9X2K1R5_9ACTN|nr:hypothetical protein [Nonomuraea thailandensis]MCP2353801.1 hypothetical protein [Nonomuraea thailandensis]
MTHHHRWPFDEPQEACVIIQLDILHDHMALHRVGYDHDAEGAFYSRAPQEEDDLDEYESEACPRKCTR